jgi:4-amino-4-deoxy-L-arabinose transferase-like glycosyltransferase
LWRWAYLALGLAVLTKGPVALVLAGLIWGLWVLLMGAENRLPSPPPQPSPLKGEGVKGNVYLRRRLIYQRRPWLALVQPRAWLLLLALSLPWFIWVQWRYPDFLRFFILEHHVGRYLAAELHPQPLYYYLPVLLGLMLPWCLLVPWRVGRRPGAADPDRAFLLGWAGVVLVFFSLSRGKLPAYILPALLPLALLLGKNLSARERRGGGLVLSLAVWALAGWAMLALYWRPPAFLLPKLAPAEIFRPYLPWALALLALPPTIALIFRRPAVLLTGALLLSTLVPLGMERLSRQRSPREPGRMVKSLWQPDAALVGVQVYSPGLSFYSGQVFHLLDLKSELDFGRALAPESGVFFSGPAQMAGFARTRPWVFFFLKGDNLPGLKRALPGDYLILGRYKNCLLAAYEGK